jgi:molecular chaperone Hsp33
MTLEKRELAFKCNCSRKKIEEVLISLGSGEISDIIRRDGGTEVSCEFCREVYRFSRKDLEQLSVEIDSRSSDERNLDTLI